VLRDGKLQIVRTADDVVVYSRGNGDINRVYLASNGWLYLLKAGVNDEQFRNPDGWRDLGTPSQDYLASRKGIVGLTGWFENDVTTLFEVPTQVYDPQLVFCPVTGALRLVNRQAKSKNGDKDRDNWVYDGEVGERSAYVTLYVGDAKSDDRLLPTQVLNVGESLVDERGATITRSSAMMSLDELEISRRDLHTVVGEEPKNSNGDPLYDPTYTAFAIKRSGRSHDRSLSDVLSNNWYHEDLAWNAEKLSQSGPYVVAMDGNGRLTINAQNIDSG
jgi:hypothetical protein